MENHVVIKKIGNKENKKKENVDDEDAKQTIHSDNVIELYKTFKIEKRIMPHTLKLLKKYADYFSIEVLEQIFIQASEESVIKKYNYIKTMLDNYLYNKIFTINDIDSNYNEIDIYKTVVDELNGAINDRKKDLMIENEKLSTLDSILERTKLYPKQVG